jgi:glycosyltransferase involved in cell wall biosynthesis
MTAGSTTGGKRRIVFDVSSITRWLGPPVGIMRVEHALARHVLSRRPDIQLSFFDSAASSFRAINPAWIERLVGWDCAIDMVTLDVRRGRKGLARFRPSRYPLTMALERRRLTAARPAVRRLIDRVQRLIWLSRGLPPPFVDGRGSRFNLVPVDLALGAPLALGPDDVVVSVGDDWFHKDAAAIAEIKQRCGFRYVVMCYDLIPVLFPAFFPARDTALFQRHWTAMFAIADRVLVTSRRVESDIREFCGKSGIEVGEVVIVSLGYDPVQADPAFTLPRGLKPGKFALFVGTIEPRKGHAMLIDVWRRLVSRGLPQRHGFKLVLVGRPGWCVEDLLRQIAEEPAFEGTLLHFAGIAEDLLAGLYRNAAFCLYPSVYEGFGLPVIEAFAHGKAVIASAGGALPETVGTFSPCLPATDAEAWLATIQRWIEDEGARRPYEELIRRSFAHPDWDQAATNIFEAVRMDG